MSPPPTLRGGQDGAIKRSYLKNKRHPWAGTRGQSPDFFIQPLVSPQRTAPTGAFNYYHYLYLFIYIGARATHSTYVETRERCGESVLIFHFIVDPKQLTQVLSSRPA